MSRFGWAYVNELITGSVGTGPTNSVQFNTGSGYLSGTSNFLFDPSTSKLTLLGLLSGSTLTISASAISASTYYGITGGGGTPGGSNTAIQFNSGSSFSGSNNFTFDYITNTMYLTGTLRADNIIVSSSQILKSGSTIFGDDAGDTHQFTGSVYLKNNLSVSGAAEVTGNLKSLGQISSSLDLATNSNVTAVGNIITTGGSLSASSGVNTNGTMFAASNITSNGIVSSSGGVNTNAVVYAAGGVRSPLNIATSASMYASSSYVSGNLYVSGTSFLGPISSTGNISGSGFTGDGFGITGILGNNVNGVGNDWAIQYKNGSTGTLTGSSNFLLSGSRVTVTGTMALTGTLSSSYLYGDASNLTNIAPFNSATGTRILQCYFPSSNTANFVTIPHNASVPIVKQAGGGSIQGIGSADILGGVAYAELNTGATTDTNDSLSTCIKWNSGADNDYYTSSMNPTFTTRIRTDGDITNVAYYFGFRVAANIGAGSTVFTNFTGSGADHFIGVGYATSSTITTNGNWYLLIQSASATTKYDTGIAVASATKYDISLSYTTGSATVTINGTSATVTTGSIPNSFLSPNISISTLTNLAKRLYFVGYDVRY